MGSANPKQERTTVDQSGRLCADTPVRGIGGACCGEDEQRDIEKSWRESAHKKPGNHSSSLAFERISAAIILGMRIRVLTGLALCVVSSANTGKDRR